MAASSILTPTPTAMTTESIYIDHPQLRDLVCCPRQRGVVMYVADGPGEDKAIVEQNITERGAPRRTLAQLHFPPSSLTALRLGANDADTLIAAGGREADLHLSYHKYSGDAPLWKFNCKVPGTLNNSVLLTRATSSSAEPRVGISNNDFTFRLYDCAIRRQHPGPSANYNPNLNLMQQPEDMLECVGALKLDNCVNYASLSPSGRLLLSVADTGNLYLHHISGSSKVDFYPMAILPIPLPTNPPPNYPTSRPSTFTASFATAFTKDGTKFAVGSQEGVVAMWDIRSSKPLKVWQVDKMRGMGPGGLGAAAGWISWDPTQWWTTRPPSWSVRNVKFVGGENGQKELLAFAEHTSLVHLIDAQTLDSEEIVRVPGRAYIPDPPSPPLPSYSPLESPLDYIHLDLPQPPLTPSVYYAFYDYPIYNPGSNPFLPFIPPPSISSSTASSSSSQNSASNSGSDAGAGAARRKASNRPEAGVDYTLVDGFMYSAPGFEEAPDIDIAGLCFDPEGRWMYVGTTEHIVEYGVRR